MVRCNICGTFTYTSTETITYMEQKITNVCQECHKLISEDKYTELKERINNIRDKKRHDSELDKPIRETMHPPSRGVGFRFIREPVWFWGKYDDDGWEFVTKLITECPECGAEQKTYEYERYFICPSCQTQYELTTSYQIKPKQWNKTLKRI